MRSCKRAGRSWSRVGCGRSCDEDAKHRDIPRVYVAADCAVLEQRSCHSDTDTEIEACAQRQRHGRSRRAPPKPVINNVTMRTPKASDKQHHRLAQLSLYSSVHVRNAVCCVKFYASVRAQRQRHRRSRRAPPVLRQVLMHRHRRGHSTRTRVASSSAAPPPLTSFHGDCKWLRQVLPGYSRVRVINNAVHGAHPQSQ